MPSELACRLARIREKRRYTLKTRRLSRSVDNVQYTTTEPNIPQQKGSQNRPNTLEQVAQMERTSHDRAQGPAAVHRFGPLLLIGHRLPRVLVVTARADAATIQSFAYQYH